MLVSLLVLSTTSDVDVLVNGDCVYCCWKLKQPCMIWMFVCNMVCNVESIAITCGNVPWRQFIMLHQKVCGQFVVSIVGRVC